MHDPDDWDESVAWEFVGAGWSWPSFFVLTFAGIALLLWHYYG